MAAGGVVGAEARLAVGGVLPHQPSDFPWSTLLINTTGCVIVGALVAVLVARAANPLARLFLVVGVLGGYTTFSGYSVDAVRLLDVGRPAAAVAYLLATVLLALAAVVAGGALAGAVLGVRGGPPAGTDAGGES